MSNNHVITKDVGNLRGFSTDSSFVRSPNVATHAINLQRNPDTTLGPRRGYQCKTDDIGGMGTGTYDNPILGDIETITINDDGNLYKLLNKQIYFYYNGRVDGSVTNIDLGFNPVRVTAPSHGLTTGTIITLNNIPGTVQVNSQVYTITVIDPNTFELDGQSPAGLDPYGVGVGEWSIEFTQYRHLVFTIFTDPRFLDSNPGWSVAPWGISPWGTPSGESITCQITVNRSARIDGNQSSVNTITVELGHEIAANDVVKFTDSSGTAQQRDVLSATATSITIDGSPVSVSDNAYIAQFFDIPFRRGFDVVTPFTITSFISQITDATNGIYGLEVVANGDTGYPAAFLKLVEPTIINDNTVYTIDYCYWEEANRTVATTFAGSANTVYQNAEDFENASFATFDDVAYIANGIDFPQKYDGQTVYRVGMPKGVRPTLTEANAGAGSLDNGNYTYIVTYEQVDAIGHIAEGAASESQTIVIESGPSDVNVEVTNLLANSGWNTNGALSDGGATSVYGPDTDGYQYHLLSVQVSPHTMDIGDMAFFLNRSAAQTDGASSSAGNTMTVDSGHVVEVNELVVFDDVNGVRLQRFVTEVTPTSITFDGSPAEWADNEVISSNKTGLVYGDLAIVNGVQNNVNTLTVLTGHTIQVGDLVTFTDTSSRIQRREVTAIGATSVTIDGPAVSTLSGILLVSNVIRGDQFYVRMPENGTTPATLSNNDPISNNLRINIYRTIQDGDLFYLLTSLPNDSISNTNQVYIDEVEAGRISGAITDITQANPGVFTSIGHGLNDDMQITISGVLGMVEVNDRNYIVVVIDDDTFSLTNSDGSAVNTSGYTTYTAGGTWEVIFGDNNELITPFADPDRLPDPPPVSKYVLTYGNQLLYAGGSRRDPENSDNVFFSEGNLPEAVPAATNFFSVPSKDDDISGIGQAGTTLIVFKRKSTHAVIGDLLTSQFQVNPLSPGTNIGCVAHASIQPIGSLLYFLHSNGVYAVTENQFYPTDPFGNPVPISTPIDDVFRSENFLPQTKLVLRRAVGHNYTKDNQYLLFIPAEDAQRTQRVANENSVMLCYDYQGKNWFKWFNMNAAGGMYQIDDDLYFHERRFSGLAGNTANLYRQHRFYRLIDYADHTSAMQVEWRSSWQDLGMPEVRKKFVRCMLLINRVSNLLQFNDPELVFSSYLDRIPNLQHTIADITTVNNIRNSAWSISPWGYSLWAGYQDSFARINLRQGTVAKSMQVGIKLTGINMSFKLAGFQLEAVPEFRRTFVR